MTRRRNWIAALCMLAMSPAFPLAQAADNSISLYGLASDMTPGQAGIGGGIAADWEWTETVYIVGHAFAGMYDDVDRAQVMLGSEWRDTIGHSTGYVGVQGGVDAFRANASTEDAFARAYYDIGWEMSDTSELRFGIGYDMKANTTDRTTGVRAMWNTALENEMALFIRAELYENEKNVFAGVTWGY